MKDGGPYRRGFWCLIVTQFQGAFSDNALKSLVTFVGMGLATSARQRASIVPLLGILFSVPFLLFSMAGGFLADRFSKRSVTIGVKGFEIAVMLFALAALAAASLPMAMAAVFLMGVHSAFFGPSKYGLLPEILPKERLSWGNGVLELGTFLAIILGGASGALLYQAFGERQHWSALILLGLAGAGLVSSLGITKVPPADPTKRFRANPAGDLAAQVRRIGQDRVLSLAVLGNVYFAFLGVLVLQNVVLFGTDTLRVGELRTSYLQAAMGIGVGLGSVAAGYLSAGKIEYGLVPLGSIGLTVCAAALGRPSISFAGALANLALLGFFGGFFIVPVAAIIQHRPASEDKGGALAAANLLSFVGVLLASAAYWLLTGPLGLAPRPIFLFHAVMTAAATLYALWLLPQALLRLLLWMATHTVYRIRVEGRENVPARGGALFVSNHLSFVDALLLIGSTDRFVRFIMFEGHYQRPLLEPLARLMRVIPISSQQRPRELVASLRTAGEAVASGQIVCIFAEGQISRTGQMLPFRRGFERIMKGVDAPIVPVHLDGVWGSIFSFQKGRFFWKLPRRIPYPVTVSFGRPLPPSSTPFEVRRAVQELGSAAWIRRKSRMKTLARGYVAVARRHPWRFAMADDRSGSVRFGTALAGAIFLGRRLRRIWRGQERVGILLPPSVAAAQVNFAALLSRRVPVNLNYTLSQETLASCVAQSGITTVVSSRAFLERVPLTVPCGMVLLEDAAAGPGWFERLAALAMAAAFPVRLLERRLGDRGPRRRLDDPATIIFSSGSTGEPKGVILTHYNVASNVEQLGQTFALEAGDRILGVLPFFHSFGFTGTLILPALLGAGVVYHPSPLDARAIGSLVRRHRITFLVATPTFLQIYMRGCAPEDLGSVRFILTGAEKLPERLASAFEDRFGIRPMEGYGCTECSPVVTVNRQDFRAAGFRQVGFKRGAIGHPLPGVSVRIVDLGTGEPLPAGEPGLLLIRGPNVMQGYLGRPDLTAEAIRDGWYVTGDIASEDEDGFLHITDRLSRFSKIGGEMVPHVKVEDKLHELAGAGEDQIFAVAGVPDEKKGERLVVLHTLDEERLAACLEKLPRAGLPNLWTPRADAFYRIDALPYLGTGKLNLKRVRDIARELAGR